MATAIEVKLDNLCERIDELKTQLADHEHMDNQRFDGVLAAINAESEKIRAVNMDFTLWKSNTAVIVVIILGVMAFLGPIAGSYVSAKWIIPPHEDAIQELIREVKELKSRP